MPFTLGAGNYYLITLHELFNDVLHKGLLVLGSQEDLTTVFIAGSSIRCQ
jgi:hypothetical protein